MAVDLPQRSSSSASSHAGHTDLAAAGKSSNRSGSRRASTGAGESGHSTRSTSPTPSGKTTMGTRAASPAILAPSPRLTPLDGHEDRYHRHARRNPGGSPEEDEESDGEMDIAHPHASWAEDDLGTASSKASSPDVPSADDAVRAAFGAGEPLSEGRAGASTQAHPLAEQPPSPPLWEQIEPPLDSEQRDPHGSSNTRVVHEYSSAKPLRSRPLIPYSSYYFGPPPPDAAFWTRPVGRIGVHHPREIVRIERDYSGGELPQFASVYPLELEGRLTPTQFLETINSINELLISAHSLRHAFIDNTLSFLTLQLSRFIKRSHYEKEMLRLQHLIDDTNVRLYNPVGLNILWPRRAAFMFLEIEYY